MLKDYLPYYMQEYREIKEICAAGDMELNEIQAYTDKIQKELFLETAEGFGLKRIESMLGIDSSADESIDYRKFRIRTKLSGISSSIKERLNKLLPDEEYTFKLDPANLSLTVKLPVSKGMYLSSVNEMLENTVPMNIALSCSILYTPNINIKKYTHKQLNSYTHKFIKEELYEQ